MALIVRERLHIIPGLVWLNFTTSGWTSTSFHFGLATYNTKLGWTWHIAPGVSYRASKRAARHPHGRRSAAPTGRAHSGGTLVFWALVGLVIFVAVRTDHLSWLW